MRPDTTCLTAQYVPSRKHPPCPYSYMQDTEYKCRLIDILVEAKTQGKTSQDLINEGVLSRSTLLTFWGYCVNLKVANPEAECNECGECCKMWAYKKYAEHPDKPCKPLDGTIKNPANPCTKLMKKGTKYLCSLKGTPDFPQVCAEFPNGHEYDLFMQLLDGDLLVCVESPSPQVKMKTCPSCVYEFVRSEG